jgi:chromosomal replication initiation ATPase DnaA
MPLQPQQQILQLQIPVSFEYGDWIRHAGVEQACNRLALWLVHGGRIWLTSPAMSGKTHLLNVLQQEHPRMGLIQVPLQSDTPAIALVDAWLRQLRDKAFWAVDVNAGDVPINIGQALFHLLERARDMHRPLLLSWRPADQNSGPPELMSRLKGTMEYLLADEPGSDNALRAVLESVARSRQWDIQPAALDTMLQWLPRRLDVLIPALLHLESISLADRKKRLSQSWIREQLADPLKI